MKTQSGHTATDAPLIPGQAIPDASESEARLDGNLRHPAVFN